MNATTSILEKTTNELSSNEQEGLGVGPQNPNAKPEIISWLETRVEQLLQRIHEEEFWRVVMDAKTPEVVVKAIMKEVYLEIVGYQPHVIEAAIASIAQM